MMSALIFGALGFLGRTHRRGRWGLIIGALLSGFTSTAKDTSKALGSFADRMNAKAAETEPDAT